MLPCRVGPRQRDVPELAIASVYDLGWTGGRIVAGIRGKKGPSPSQPDGRYAGYSMDLARFGPAGRAG